MSIISERVNKVKAAELKIQEHCMCFGLEISGHYRVIYPEGYWPEGVQCGWGEGKLIAAEKILNIMEQHWKDNYL